MIVIGNYLLGYNKPSHAISKKIPEENFIEVINNCDVFEIEQPPKLLGKRELQKYISDNLIAPLNF